MSLAPLAVHAARATLLLGAGLLATRLLHRASASARHWVLALTLISVVLLPAVEAAAPRWRVVPAWAAAASAPRAQAPFAEPLVSAAPLPSRDVVGPTAPSETAPRRFPWATAVALLWAAGALVVLARAAAGVLRARRLVRGARPLAAPDGTLVRCAEELASPLVAGVFAPVILVPTAAAEWGRERWHVVLLHERAHVAQHDGAVQLVAHLATALHWWNPLVWLAARRLCAERELSADEAVLSAGVRPSAYAEHLLAFAARPPALGAIGMAESPLFARMRAILEPRPAPRFSGRARAATALVGAAVLTLLACAESRQDPAGSAPPAAPTARTAPTPDGRLQTIADEEVARARAEWDAASALAIVLDPATGAVLAVGGDRDAADRAGPPGSTLKAFTFAGALEDGAVRATDRVDCANGARAYGDRTLRDAHPYGWLDLADVLAVSSNVGAARVAEALGGERTAGWLRRFHFGEGPGQLPGGFDPATFEGATVVLGVGMSATPMQIAAGYAALAAGGVYRSPGGGASSGDERVVSAATARAVVEMLTRVVEGERGTGAAARVPGVRVAGKTATVARPAAPGDTGERVYASFVGIAPADAPRYVVLVGVETARAGAAGGTVAAPVFARIARRALGF